MLNKDKIWKHNLQVKDAGDSVKEIDSVEKYTCHGSNIISSNKNISNDLKITYERIQFICWNFLPKKNDPKTCESCSFFAWSWKYSCKLRWVSCLCLTVDEMWRAFFRGTTDDGWLEFVLIYTLITHYLQWRSVHKKRTSSVNTWDLVNQNSCYLDILIDPN